MDSQKQRRPTWHYVAGGVAVTIVAVSSLAIYFDQKAKQEKEQQCVKYEELMSDQIRNLFALGAKGRGLEEAISNSINFGLIMPAIQDNLMAIQKAKQESIRTIESFKSFCGEARYKKWYQENFEKVRLEGDPKADG